MRVIKPGGVLRIVMPDYFFLCKEFIKNFENQDFEKADFIKILTLDQCVRTNRGGYLKKYLLDVHNNDDQDLKEYILEIIGEDFEAMNNSMTLFEQLNFSNFFKLLEILWIYFCLLYTSPSPRDGD